MASTTEAVVAALSMPEEDRLRLGAAGHVRCLASHTATHRAAELVTAIKASSRSSRLSFPSDVSER